MSRASWSRRPLRLKGATPLAGPTRERRRHAEREGGFGRLALAEGGFVAGLHCPLEVDRLRSRGLLEPEAHAAAIFARELFERTSFRGRLVASYRERTGMTAADPEQEEADDRYRSLERRIIARAGRAAWTAYRDTVIEDRPLGAGQALAALNAALRVVVGFR